MKRQTIYILILTFVLVLCLVTFDNDKVSIEVENSISLRVSIDGQIKEMDMEEYLVGVVAGEMYADYHIEALKAQAVTARTYTCHKLINGGCNKDGADICDDIGCCQAYAKTISSDAKVKLEEAVYSTKDEIITYDGKPIVALFHSTSGGYTEDNVNVFGRDLPYLKGVKSEGEEGSPSYSREEVRSMASIKEEVKGEEEDITILERLDSGRVKKVSVCGVEMSGKELRERLGLSSANFTVHIEGDKVIFKTVGYGHGVGLSQVGANYMATAGKSYKEIIKHYYTGVEILDIDKAGDL